MNQDNKNTIIGMGLIVLILLAWNYYSMPSQAQLDEQKRQRDSIALVQQRTDSLNKIQKITQQQPTFNNDSLNRLAQLSNFGSFAAVSNCAEQTFTRENDVFKITFTNKGGRIKEVLLKNHYKIQEDDKRNEQKSPLKLFEDGRNRFEFVIPANNPKGKISTEELCFTPSVSGNTVVFRAQANDQTWIEQKYTLGGGYDIDYDVQMKGLGAIAAQNAATVQLNVENWIDKLEKNAGYESSYSYLRYKENAQTPSYLSGTSYEAKDLTSKPIDWVAHANQFFNTSIISQDGGFKSAKLESHFFDYRHESDLKKMTSKLEIPLNNGEVNSKMKLFIGPNDYSILKKYGNKLEDIVDYGGSILGTINRWFIRPIFDFLHGFIPNVAICILLLTLLVKAILYPLSYKMLTSQAKTAALKPEIEKLKVKYKDDAQKVQMEQMKLYQEFGVNPLGGCLPTLLQMPIWMALFRFFPASIDFRQKGFLWATDLTGFEEFIKFPAGFSIPLYGSHISLFAILWGISLIAFTWYSMKDVDMTGQPAFMKQLQYFTPILFTVMFNSYAAGLSLYMLFSNILNIGQTIVTKNYIIDKEKIRKELEENKKKPKKQGLFRQKLEEAMKAQQMIKEEQEKQKNKKK